MSLGSRSDPGAASPPKRDGFNPLNRKVRAIVRREYSQRIRSKWFLISTFGLPLLFLGLAALSGWLGTREEGDPSTLTAAVVGRSPGLAGIVRDELRAHSVQAVVAADLGTVREDSLASRLLASGHDLIIVIPPGVLTAPDGVAGSEGARPVRVLAKEAVDPLTRRTIDEAVHRAFVRARLEAAGVREVDPATLLREMGLEVVTVSEEGTRSQEAFEVLSFVLALLFYMVLLIYGQMIVRSILEEKTSDIVEVMVSSVRPWELMLGKIFGVGALGLTQITIWGLVIGGVALYGLTAGAAVLAETGIDVSAISVPAGGLLASLVFLTLGYFLYAGLFAAAGGTLSREEDAQQAVFPVIVLIIIPFFLAQGVIRSPNATWSVLTSLVPFFSPLLFPSRLLIASVPPWQTATALVLLLATILLTAWLAGRIYRVGILMKGKRPNLPELFRWVRHG